MAGSSDLSEIEHLVLLAVLRLGEEAYGARIRSELLAQVGRAPSISTIYLALLRLEQRGLVDSTLTEPTPIRGGKAKRVYAPTRAGVKALRSARRALARLWLGQEAILGDNA